MTTITTPRSNQIKSVKNLKNHNEKISLLGALKKVSTSFRISELQNLINEKEKLETPKWNIALIAIINLFPKEERFDPLELLKNNFDIRLTDSEIEKLKKCLLNDPKFKRLLPSEERKFLTFSTERKISNNNITQNNQAHNVNHRKTKLKISILPVIKEETEFSKNIRQNNSPLRDEKSIRKSKLQDLRLLMITKNPTLRYQFFISLKADYQSLANRMNVEEFKNFIEIFPPNDAIKFLNLPFIRNQVEGLQRQNGQLSKESYIDLLNYFKSYQKDSVKKLLRPISATIDTKWVQQGMFKEKTLPKIEQLKVLPDIVISHNVVRTR